MMEGGGSIFMSFVPFLFIVLFIYLSIKFRIVRLVLLFFFGPLLTITGLSLCNKDEITVGICLLLIGILMIFAGIKSITKKNSKNSELKKNLNIILIVTGIIFIVLGLISLIYGVNLNNNLKLQLESLFKIGSIDQGTPYIIAGIVGIILGFIMLVVGIILKLKINMKPEINKLELNNSEEKKENKYIQFIGKNWKDILCENNLDNYIDLFEKNRLNEINIISQLTDHDLEKLGITIMGDRKRILNIFTI